MLIEEHNGGEMASRECSNCYSKRNREDHIFLTSLTYLLGISRKLKSRLIVWSSGDVSTVVGVQIPSLGTEESPPPRFLRD